VRSLRARRGGAALLYALLLAAGAGGFCAATEAPAITDAEVARAAAEVAADPDMGAEHTMHMLQFHPSTTPRPPGSTLHWLASLLNWLASAGRLLFWILVAMLAAILLVLLLRALRAPRKRTAAGAGEALATHIGTLDIRPESLPDDIGAAALALWDAGRQRAALSLLYRGTLSRLVHRHAVPIQDSNTETECVVLATTHLTVERAHFVRQLIECWVRAVYAERMPASATVHDLCSGFGTLLDAAAQDLAVAVKA
jgi:hypothetical protein